MSSDKSDIDFYDLTERFYNFFESEKQTIIKRSHSEGKNYIEVSYEELLEYDPYLVDSLLENPEETIKIMEKSLESIEKTKFRVRITSLPNSEKVFIRDIRSKHLGKLVLIEGLVRRKSDVRPRLVCKEYLCNNPDCSYSKNKLKVEQREIKTKVLKVCPKCKGPVSEINNVLVDAQNLVLEEIVEQTETGDQPKRINVMLQEDLVSPMKDRKTNPGRKVYVIGFVREFPIPSRTGAKTVNYDLLIDANYIGTIEEDYSDIEIDKEDLKKIEELSKREDIYDLLAENLAPSIFGHNKIKESIVLQLFGGSKVVRGDGVKTRGDIHILLVGDPGSAKSQMLKSTIKLAPKGIMVSGKSASSAGLTAAVVRDDLTKGWALEAGALVLASGGVCAIDELDKMSRDDTSAMHEALEQQTISIAKANIRATLISETTVLAAANPKMGRFDPYSSIAKQINLPPSLINRFDLIFVIQDLPDKTRDSLIAEHILRVHKDKDKTKRIIDETLLKKYIAYTKEKINPILTNEAIKKINKFYVDLRNSGNNDGDEIKSIPISARQLEAIVRLSEAYAKIQLKNKVTVEHAERAINLMMYALEKIGVDPKTGKIDIDTITTGISASVRNTYRVVKNIIDKLELELPEITFDAILEEAEKKNVSKEDLLMAIDKLKEEGIIYEPRKKIYKKMM